MPSDQPGQKSQNAGNPSTEPKTRGANRSTKVAGKLKVLPEQPELVTVKAVDLPGPPRDHDETMGTTGDSDEGDIDDDDEEPRNVEVGCHGCLVQIVQILRLETGIQPNLSNTRWNSQERCFKTDQEKSQIVAQSDGVCDSHVSSEF